MAATVRTDILAMLSLVSDDHLEAILTSLDLTVTPERRKKDKAIFNAIVRHLTSEELEDLADEGLSIFLKLKGDLTEMVKEKNGDKVEEDEKLKAAQVEKHVVTPTVEEVVPKSEPVNHRSNDVGMRAGEEKSKAALSTTRVEYHRVKDFRIEGGTVCGTLSYRNVRYQMDKGRELGYSKKEVMNGTIKAMKPGTLRTYCETSGTDLGYDEFVELLHNYSGVEDATLMLTRLNNSFQGDEYADEKKEEKETDFVLRVGGLRKTVMKIAKEEGTDLSEEIVSKAFRHALSVGIRRDVIRLQVQNIFQGHASISDQELLRKIQLIMSMDKENQKTKGHSSAGVNATYLDNQSQHLSREDVPRLPPPRSEQDSRLDNLILELQSVNVNIEQERKERRSEMDEMRGKIAKLERSLQPGDSNRDGGNKRKFVKCKSCEQQQLFCNHCAKCGEGGHKQRDCKKN